MRMADENVWVGGALSADSYLSIPSIISAAKRTNSTAIHPGMNPIILDISNILAVVRIWISQ